MNKILNHCEQFSDVICHQLTKPLVLKSRKFNLPSKVLNQDEIRLTYGVNTKLIDGIFYPNTLRNSGLPSKRVNTLHNE